MFVVPLLQEADRRKKGSKNVTDHKLIFPFHNSIFNIASVDKVIRENDKFDIVESETEWMGKSQVSRMIYKLDHTHILYSFHNKRRLS